MDDRYDEFGNRVGPFAEDDESNSESESYDSGHGVDQKDDNVGAGVGLVPEYSSSEEGSDGEESRVVARLHEDKQYYRDAREVYPKDTELMYQAEDARAASEPIIKPTIHISELDALLTRSVFESTYKKEYLLDVLGVPSRIRNVVVCGAIHHGKTSLLDLLLAETHPELYPLLSSSSAQQHPDSPVHITRKLDSGSAPRLSDHVVEMEKDRGMTIRSKPCCLLLEDSKGTSFAVNLMDTPGHVDFLDEVSAGVRMADGLLICVDAVEGVSLATRTIVSHALAQAGLHSCKRVSAVHGAGGASGIGASADGGALSAILVVTKIDRLMTELKLPPRDAYFKLRFIVDEMNSLLPDDNSHARFNPAVGNVLFSSAAFGFCFSLRQFAHLYTSTYGDLFDPVAFSANLWGDRFMDPQSRKFVSSSLHGVERSFVQFILNPMYKLFSHCISIEGRDLKAFLQKANVLISHDELLQDLRPLLRTVFARFFSVHSPNKSSFAGLADAIVTHIPSPLQNSHRKAQQLFAGNLESARGSALLHADSSATAPLLGLISRVLDVSYLLRGNEKEGGLHCMALVRVMSGSLQAGMKVRVFAENHSVHDDSDVHDCVISNVYAAVFPFYGMKFSGPATVGTWVVVQSISDVLIRGGTLQGPLPASSLQEMTDGDGDDDDDDDEGADKQDREDGESIFVPLSLPYRSNMRIAIDPRVPSELPKLLEGIRLLRKSFLALEFYVEESGLRYIGGPGEMYLDCAIQLLRERYAGIEINVSDPFVAFHESVSRMSAFRCFSESVNKENKLTMIAEPLDPRIATCMEKGYLPAAELDRANKKSDLSEALMTEFQWDALAARRVWVFSPYDSPVVLSDDTLPGEVDPKLLSHVRESCAKGFSWACKEGPLCAEPMRNVSCRIVDAVISSDPLLRSSGNITPAARRVVCASVLTANPRLLEPVNLVEILTPVEQMSIVTSVVSRRRGVLLWEGPRGGTPLHCIHAHVPLLESFGFEVDLRVATNGLAFPQALFSHWSEIPGDPLDKSIPVRMLEPAPKPYLARDCLVKTRRRKGLPDDIGFRKYFEDEMIDEMAKIDRIFASHV
eukprot:ANDGO_07032.mRNA.1 Pre-mRNA-splicing factor cwf10